MTLKDLAFDHAEVGVALLGASGRIIEANPYLWRLLGYQPDEFAQQSALNLVNAPDWPLCREVFRGVRDGQSGGATFEIEIVHSSGQRRHCVLRLAATPPQDDGRLYVVAVLQDVSHERQLAAKLRRLSHEDHLTRLLNRRGFLARAHILLDEATARQESVAPLYCDVDGLKAINDQAGHLAGDEALRRVARVLAATFRSSDLVARIGGDEFVVLLPGTSAQQARELQARLCNMLGAEPCTDRKLSVSLGLAISDAQKPIALGRLLTRADRRMYEDKTSRPEAGDALGQRRDEGRDWSAELPR